jgi:hypothetical protein
MKVLFHPEFAQDILRYRRDYQQISTALAVRFQNEIDRAVQAVIRSPGGAGHFVQNGSKVIEELRRRNLQSFPFFILYGSVGNQLVFGSVIPSRSDPITWLSRFQGE